MEREQITDRDVAEYKRELLENTVLVATKTAAEILACSERTVHRMISDGDLHRYSRVPGSRGVRVLARELREYVDSIKVDHEW